MVKLCFYMVFRGGRQWKFAFNMVLQRRQTAKICFQYGKYGWDGNYDGNEKQMLYGD